MLQSRVISAAHFARADLFNEPAIIRASITAALRGAPVQLRDVSGVDHTAPPDSLRVRCRPRFAGERARSACDLRLLQPPVRRGGRYLHEREATRSMQRGADPAGELLDKISGTPFESV